MEPIVWLDVKLGETKSRARFPLNQVIKVAYLKRQHEDVFEQVFIYLHGDISLALASYLNGENEDIKQLRFCKLLPDKIGQEK